MPPRKAARGSKNPQDAYLALKETLKAQPSGDGVGKQ
eukprot:gene3669-4094_t